MPSHSEQTVLVGKLHLPVQHPNLLDGLANAESVSPPVRAAVSNRHPCFGGAAVHTRKGRIHLPVAPHCNIGCLFCTRGIHAHRQRPGTAGRLLRPDEAVPAVKRALELCPDISVVGVAGPGDALASEHAIEALRHVHQHFPELIKCISTNGLLLPERADDLWAAGVRSVTVTVNAVDPTRLVELCPRIVWNGQVLKGLDAARRLVEQQITGIRRLNSLGAVIKVNTVLVPGVNDEHIKAIVDTMAQAGAHVGNVIPLIPNGRFKLHSPPTQEQLEAARGVAESRLAVNRTCRQCRADACGVPGSGKDFARDVFGEDVVNGDSFSHG